MKHYDRLKLVQSIMKSEKKKFKFLKDLENGWSQDPNYRLHPQVLSSGRPCLLFQARKLSVRYERQKQLDLTDRAFSPQKAVDISKSVCRQDKATYVSQKRHSRLLLSSLCASTLLFFELSFYLSVRLPPQGWSWGLEMWRIWEVSPSGTPHVFHLLHSHN